MQCLGAFGRPGSSVASFSGRCAEGPLTNGVGPAFRERTQLRVRRLGNDVSGLCSSGAWPATCTSSSSLSSSSSSSRASRQRRGGPCCALSTDFSKDTQQQLQRAQDSAAASNPSSSGRPQSPATDKVGVLLLNLGGPETLQDVRPFLYNLFADPDIIRLPSGLQFLQPVLASTIATLRAPKSAEGYKAIGGGSPLRRITDEQAAALAASMRAKGLDAEVYVAMRYWHPYTEEALQYLIRDGVNKLVILPLYPQFSISTSGSSLRLLEALFKQDPVLRNLPHTVIPSWYQRPGYVAAMVDLIEAELDQFGDPAKVRVFFSAHGVPKTYVTEAGDPYKEEMEHCVALIVAELERRGRGNPHTLAYQSRVGPVEWLQPYTDDSIRELGASGCKSLLAVPISFVSEHIETLEEMDMEYRELAEEYGVTHWRRVPALNTHPGFIGDLADAVIEALPYVGAMASAPPSSGDSLVPMGDLEALLEAYDRERRALPAPIGPWQWGFTKSAETWNGRIAMVAIIVMLLLEVTTGQPILSKMMTID